MAESFVDIFKNRPDLADRWEEREREARVERARAVGQAFRRSVAQHRIEKTRAPDVLRDAAQQLVDARLGRYPVAKSGPDPYVDIRKSRPEAHAVLHVRDTLKRSGFTDDDIQRADKLAMIALGWDAYSAMPDVEVTGEDLLLATTPGWVEVRRR